MKKKGFLIALFVIAATIVSGQRVVKVGAFNFYPGIFQDTDGKVKGFYVDALNEIAEKENLKFEYVYGSWNDGLERMKMGEIDMLTSVAFSEERAAYMDYASVPLLTVWGEVYVVPASHINGILDLKDKKVAIMKGDMNGRHLQDLMNKFAFTCTFIETDGFEDVFNLIVSGEVDAGVVNNTYGASKYQEFNLRSSGIIFNPFDIFFTVGKNQNRELLETLNKYLHNWQHNKNSVYNLARQKWAHGKIGSIVIIPVWVKNAIYFAGFLIVVLILFVVLLRYKVQIATRKVLKSEAIFKAFMENTPAFVYIKDENLNHVYKNRMVENVVNSANVIEQTSAKVIFEPHIAEMLEKTDREVLNSESKQIDLQYFCKMKDREVWLHDYKFYLKLPDEKPAIGGISFDITKQKETEQELIKAKEHAEESDRLKSSFLANLSHEIRTPLNSIMGFASLLPEADSKEIITEYSGIIEKNSEHLVSLIDDIVLYSKLQSKLLVCKPTSFAFGKLMSDVQNSFKLPAYQSKVAIRFECNLPADIVIFTDYNKLWQITINLISNAFKYTKQGEIIVRCSLNDHNLEFEVKDTGIGILPNELEHIFDRFFRGTNIDEPTTRGTGLGLSIVKELTELLGGKISVESEPGIGSTFYFTLPIAK